MTRKQAAQSAIQAMALRQLSDALRSGLPVTEAVAVLAKRRPDDVGGPSPGKWAAASAQGVPLSRSLADEGFGDAALALVRQGEETDSLADALDVIAKDLEYRSLARNAMQGALAWPLTSVAVLAVVIAMTALFVIPVFKDLFRSFGADLPAPTLIVVAVSDFVVTWWLAFAAVAALVAWMLTRSKSRERWRAPLERLAMRVPYLQDYLRAVFVVRLVHLVALTAQPALLGRGVEYLRSTAGNAHLAGIAAELAADLRAGRALVDSLWTVRGIPSNVAAAVEIGTLSNKLAPAMERLAATQEFTAALSLVRFQQVTTIALYATLAVIVGFTVIAVYLPIFRLGQAI